VEEKVAGGREAMGADSLAMRRARGTRVYAGAAMQLVDRLLTC